MRHELVKLLKQRIRREYFSPAFQSARFHSNQYLDEHLKNRTEQRRREMLTRKAKILKGNLAFMPLVVLLAALGFRMEAAKTNKIFRLLRSTTSVIVLLLSSSFISYSVEGSVVVATITYINARCIFFTLIIIYIRNVVPKAHLRKVFKCLDNIDLRLHSLDVRIKGDESKWLVRVMLLLIAVVAFSSFAIDFYNDKAINVGQLIHAMLVFVLSVKILFYCMLCASIKVRFRALIKYLKDSKSTPTQAMIVATTKRVDTSSAAGNLSQLKGVSLIYDEVLEVISLVNESFSTILSFAFGELCLG